MTTLKTKIINALQHDEPLNPVINKAEESQENLLKNHSNKILDKSQKNVILEKFSDLKEFIQSLFRYNTLKENGYAKDAQEEKETLENMVLQGYISNTKYVWHTESGKNTCEECKALDGQEFDFYDELPEIPHPNCKCVLKVIKVDETEPLETSAEKQKEQQKSTSSDNSTEHDLESPHKGWIMPCDGPITSKYGWRIHPITKKEKFHRGWDIGVSVGTPVKAIADGTVTYAGDNDPTGYGRYIIINHGKINGVSVTSEYGHLSMWHVISGQRVKKGQIVATSGNTGGSTGPHLHITIKENGQHVNPGKYIKK